MENQRLPNNTTLGGLRRLAKATKEIVGQKEAVEISLSLWHYDNIVGSGRVCERIGVYHSGGGPTEEFASLGDAYLYLKRIKKGETK